MKKRFLGIILCLAMIASLLPLPAFAVGETQQITESLSGSALRLQAGVTYQVAPATGDTVTMRFRAQVEGYGVTYLDLNGNNLVLENGIHVPDNHGLFISDSVGGGTLTAYAYGSQDKDGAAIGADGSSSFTETSGAIRIESGTVRAYGAANSAAIGGSWGGSNGMITITGGSVFASSAEEDNGNRAFGGPGIGGGGRGTNGSITITGGSVIAKGGSYRAGIGTGESAAAENLPKGGDILISGNANVEAYGGSGSAGIGGGMGFSAGNITIGENAAVKAVGEGSAAGIGGGGPTIQVTPGRVERNLGGRSGNITITGGSVFASTSHYNAAAIGSGSQSGFDTITISGGTVTTNGGTGIGGGKFFSPSGSDKGIAPGGTFSTTQSGSAVIVTNWVTDQAGKSGWSGRIHQGKNITVGGNQTLYSDLNVASQGDLVVLRGAVLDLSGNTLTNDGTVTNNGTIMGGTIRSNGRFFNNGTISDGAIENNELIVNKGTITGPITGTGTIGKASETAEPGDPMYRVTRGTLNRAGVSYVSGTIQLDGNDYLIPGRVLVFDVTPENGYDVDTVTVSSGTATAQGNRWTVENVTGDLTIDVTTRLGMVEHTFPSDDLWARLDAGVWIAPKNQTVNSSSGYSVGDGVEMMQTNITSDVTIRLEEGSVLYTGYLILGEGAHLTIEGSGTLIANADYSKRRGAIEFHDSDENPAQNASLVINGGTIIADSARNPYPGYPACGIGTYNYTSKPNCTITINGGNITAIGRDGSPGIGTRTTDQIGGVAIRGGILKTNGINPKDPNMKGIISEDNGQTYTVYGDVILSENFEVKKNFDGQQGEPAKLIVPKGATLTVADGVTLTNNGVIDLSGGGKILNWDPSGTILWPTTCTVTFDNQGHGIKPADMTVDIGAALTEPSALTQQGYEFGGWFRDPQCTNRWNFATDTAEADLTLYAKWTPRTDISYTVRHLLQNLQDDGYTEKADDRQTLTGTTDTQTSAAANTYTGFTAQTVVQQNIAPDGSAVVDIKYDRNTYAITWKNGDTVLKTDTLRYGAMPAYSGTPVKQEDAGYTYTFTGWSPEVSPVAGNVTYLAQYESTAKTYTLTFDSRGGSPAASITADYNAPITLPVPVKEGYAFGGWYDHPGCTGDAYQENVMPAGDLTFYALWRLNAPAVPTVSSLPENGAVVFPAKVTLSAETEELPGLEYRYDWYRDGSRVGSGKTLTLETVAQSGSYTVTVTVSDGIETSTAQSAAKIVTVSGAQIVGSIRQVGTLTYNGTVQTAETESWLSCEEGRTVTVKYGTAPGHCTEDAVPGFVSAGTHPVYFEATSPDHDRLTGSFQVVIAEKSLTVTAVDQSLSCIGELDQTRVQTLGLVSRDTLTCTLSEENGTIKVLDIAIKNAAGETVTENYVITVTDGAVTRSHSWNDPAYAWNEDHTAYTATRACAHDPSHTETVQGTVTSTITKPASCTEKGETTYTAVFDAPWAKDAAVTVPNIPALGHQWQDAAYTWNKDHTACTATRVCAHDSSHTETAQGAVTSTVQKSATCTEKGETTYTAAFDAPWAKDATVTVPDIPALGHQWQDAAYAWNEDHTAYTATRVCAHDSSHTETEQAAVTSKITKPATCTEKGETTYTAVFKVLWAKGAEVALSDVAALDHQWQDTTYTWNEDHTACTATRVCAHDPSHTETAQAAVTSKVTKAASCAAKGETTYTAVFDASWAKDTAAVVPNIPALGHQWQDAAYAWNGDHTAYTATRICRNDPSHVQTAHAAVTSEIIKPATCTEPAEVRYRAVFTEAWAADIQVTLRGAVPAGHKTGEWLRDQASHWHVCSSCEEILDRAAHTFGEWETVKNASLQEEGQQKRVCTVCGYEETRSVDKIDPPEETGGHTESVPPAVPDAPVKDDSGTFSTWLSIAALAAVAAAAVIIVIIAVRKRKR